MIPQSKALEWDRKHIKCDQKEYKSIINSKPAFCLNVQLYLIQMSYIGQMRRVMSGRGFVDYS